MTDCDMSCLKLGNIQFKLLINKLIKPIVLSIVISLLLASPYYIFGGLRQTLNYIQVVLFGANKGLWATSFSLSYNLTYYLTGRGGWMMGAWFWLDIALLHITLISVFYQRQWGLLKISIAATLIFITAYASVTIPSTKSPFLGLIVTAIILIFSYLTLNYWLEFLNNTLKKSVSKILIQILSITMILSLIFFQWKSFPFVGGGLNLLPKSETEKYHQSFNNIAMTFKNPSLVLPTTNRKEIFIPAITSFLTTSNLNLDFQFSRIYTLQATGLDLNRDNIDDLQVYKNKALISGYVILARSPSVTYPSLKNKRGNEQFGELLYQFLETSGEFERLDRQDVPIIKGEVLIYHRKN